VEIVATVKSILSPGDTFSIEWTASADSVPEVSVYQTITVDYGCGEASLSWELGQEVVGPGDTFALWLTIEHHNPRPIQDFSLTVSVPDFLDISSSPYYCTRQGNTLTCSLIGDPGTHYLSVDLTALEDVGGDEYIIMELNGRELCAPVVETARVQRPPDLVVDDMEVTQSVQDLRNSVRLIRGKPTYVRLHVHSDSGSQPGVTARLWRYADGVRQEPGLAPSNPSGVITVVSNPDRAELDDSFYFELPASWVDQRLIAGTQVFEAEVNYERDILETDYDNNVLRSDVLHFEESSPLRLRFYRVEWDDGTGTLHVPGMYHFDYIESWLRAAYPISELDATYEGKLLASNWITQGTCSEINSVLVDLWTRDGSPPNIIYFAISSGVPYGCASRPGNWGTGAADWGDRGWDFDGSMADWYAGHEIGHTRDMGHVCNVLGPWCGQVPAPACEPYIGDNGSISPTDTGPSVQYGFNTGTVAGTVEVYPWWWKDVMTYCDNEWTSGYTYEKLHDYITVQAQAATAQELHTEGERLLVIGQVDEDGGAAKLATVSRVVETWPLTAPEPAGSYSLRLLDGGGGILAQHPFTPLLEDAGQSIGPEPLSVARIYLVVPWVAGTAHVGIWHEGEELVGRDVSPNVPDVTVTYPNGGEEWATGLVTVTWETNDADTDPLTHAVQYSADGGNSWRTLVTRITDSHHVVNASLLPGSDQALIRV